MKRVGGRTSLHPWVLKARKPVDSEFPQLTRIKEESKTGAGFEPDHRGLAATNHSHWKQPDLLKTATGGKPDVPPSIGADTHKSVDSENFHSSPVNL